MFNFFIGHLLDVAQRITQTGVLRLRSGGASEFFAIAGGFAEVRRDRVAVFAETAEMSEEIDTERAHQALERAKTEQRRKDLDPMTLFQAEAAARRAALRLRVAEMRRRSKARR